MAKLQIYFFCSLILVNFQGQLAETQDNATVCVLQNAPLQCGTFCLAALHPIFDVIPKVRGQMDRIEKEQQALRRSLIEDQAKMDTQLEKVRSEMNGQLQAILSKIEGLQAAPQQTHPTNNLAEAPIVKEIPDKTPMNPTSRNQNIPAQFEQIGSRFFYIENTTEVGWIHAESICREKGGYLASIKDKEEYDTISAKLKLHQYYWLGINDVLKEGNYVSIASGKKAMYLKWARNNPEKGGRKDYVYMHNGYMYTYFEYISSHFICQADSET